MSGPVYDVGSVVQFYPIEPRSINLPGGNDHPPSGMQLQHIGYATVVVERDLWVIRTELRAVVQDGNGRLIILDNDVR